MQNTSQITIVVAGILKTLNPKPRDVIFCDLLAMCVTTPQAPQTTAVAWSNWARSAGLVTFVRNR